MDTNPTSSTILLWFANNHIEAHGAQATHVREQQEQEKRDLEAGPNGDNQTTANPQASNNSENAISQPHVNGNSQRKPEHGVEVPQNGTVAQNSTRPVQHVA